MACRRSPEELRAIIEANTDRVNGCWVWRLKVNGAGYGTLSGLNESGTHRVSFKLFSGEIPPDKHVLHRCDNRRCCNPEHLFLGTPRDNSLDCSKKGHNPSRYTPRGKDHWAYGRKWRREEALTVVSQSLREEIKAAYDSGLSTRKLADRFGITQTQVRRVLAGAKPLRQLSKAEVLSMFSQREEGATSEALAVQYQLTPTSVNRILRKDRYRYYHEDGEC